jgi:hypothetical protein
VAAGEAAEIVVGGGGVKALIMRRAYAERGIGGTVLGTRQQPSLYAQQQWIPKL